MSLVDRSLLGLDRHIDAARSREGVSLKAEHGEGRGHQYGSWRASPKVCPAEPPDATPPRSTVATAGPHGTAQDVLREALGRYGRGGLPGGAGAETALNSNLVVTFW